jgi:transcription elongation factor Elf1
MTSADQEKGSMAHTVKRVMDVDGVDWLIDAPIPCQKCGAEAIANIAILKTRNAIGCRSCGTAIDLTHPGTRAFIEEFSSVVARLLSGSDETAKTS